MFCPKCGYALKGNDAFCPSCGLNINGNSQPSVTNTNLVIARPGKVMGCAINLKITVNGTEVKLGAGDTLNFNMPVGPCSVKYKFWCRREKEVLINIQSGRQYSVIFKYDPLWGGFKIGKDSIIN